MPRKKKQLNVHAIRRNSNGSTSKRVFHGKSWDNLAPKIVMDRFGQTTKLPKQGWEQVPEGWTEEAPESLDLELLKTEVMSAQADLQLREDELEALASNDNASDDDVKNAKKAVTSAKRAATKAEKALSKASE